MNRDLSVAFLLLAVCLSGVALGATLNNAAPVSGTIPVETNSGVVVSVADNGGEMDATFVNDTHVDVVTAAGNATFSGSGTADLTVDEITGEWTNVSSVSAASNNITIDPEDKPAIGVGDDVDSVSYRAPTVDDNTVDVVYAGSTGQTTLVISGLPSNRGIRAVDADTGLLLDGGTTNNNGVVGLSGMPNSQHDVLLQTQDGGPGLSNPSPEGPQSTAPTQLSVDVTDPDFDEGENVTVTFQLDGVQVGQQTVSSAGTVSTSISQPSRGSHSVTVTATDSSSNTQTLTYSFSRPENLTVRRATDPYAIIDDRQVTATFFENGSSIETRTTTNGRIDLTGLTTSEDIVVQINASATSGMGVPNRAYYESEYILEDITEQQTAYLLDRNNTVVESRFTLQDRTSQFEGNGAQLYIQRVINRTGTAEWQTIHADLFGTAGVTTQLQQGERYRLIVMNADDDMRVLGTYTADVSETVPLTVGAVSANPEDPETQFLYNVTRVQSGGSAFARVEYNDTASLTDSVTVEIHEQGNRSNKLVNNQTFSGPIGSFALSEPIPSELNNSTLVARLTVNRDGNTQTIRIPFGPRQPILNGLAPWMRALISIGTLFVVAGLFSRLNSPVGGLVVAGLGGIFFFINFLPRETGIGVVILSMVTAGIMFLHGRQQQ